jgi:hypothetical protein
MTEPEEKKKRSVAAQLYIRGWSLRTIANYLHTSHSTITALLDNEGIIRRSGTARRWKGCIDLSGKQFGNLTVIERDGISYPPKWIVQCDLCGRRVSLPKNKLLTHKSCGCGPRGRKKKRASGRHKKKNEVIP